MATLAALPATDLSERQACLACGTTAARPAYQKWGFPIVRCDDCGLGRAVVPADFDPRSLYDAGYFQGQSPDGYADYAGSERVLRDEFCRTVAYLRRYGPAGGRLLEVGCAMGFFLAEAAPYFRATGIDVAESAVAHARARGLDAHGRLLDAAFLQQLGPLDAVVMLDVIEHLPAPDETLALLREGLVPGGCLLLTTGDWHSLYARLAGPRWRLMTPPQHLHYFSRRSLARLLQRSGFALVHCHHPWKRVPVGLALYQLLRRTGLRLPIPAVCSRLSVPVNLFDALRLIARRV